MEKSSNSFKKKMLVSSLAGIFLGSGLAQSAVAYAGLNSMLQGMLVAAGSPSAYSDQQGEVFSGGYLNVTVPNQQYNVISFAPPNVSGGCGGINLFMGSFSFISAAQFEKMLEQIGEGLLTYAFYTAISSMCSTCTTILQTLENAAQDMNNAMRNTCQLSSGVGIANFANSMGKAVNQFNTAFTSSEGLFSGFFGAKKADQTTPGSIWSKMKTKVTTEWNKVTTAWSCGVSGYSVANCPQPPTESTQETQQSESTPMYDLTPGIGNNTWRALVSSQAQTALGDAAYSIGENNITTMEIMMSMIGTVIVPPPDQNESKTESNISSGGTTSSTHTNSSNNTTWSFDLSFQSLVDGQPSTHFYACAIPPNQPGDVKYGINHPSKIAKACLAYTPESFNDIHYKGIGRYVAAMLFGGDVDGTAHNGFINDEMDPSQAPSSMMKNFISASPIPLQADAMKIDSDAGLSTANAKQQALSLLASEAYPYIVNDFAANFGEALINALNLTFAYGKHKHVEPKDFSAVMLATDAAVQKYAEANKNVAMANRAIMKDVEDIEKLPPVKAE